MATVDKNFRIKNGLVVEGTTGTINGNNILTENGGDTYILNLVGGATLVKSVDSGTFTVDGSGNLTVNSGVFDAYGAASSAQTAAQSYADGLASNYDAAGEASAAQTAAQSYADGLASNYDAAGAASAAQTAAQSYADSLAGNYDAAGTAAGLAGNYDAAGAAATAQSNAESYADTVANTAQSNAESYADTAASNALSSANTYTDGKVADLVGMAPSLLDTLEKIDAAIANDANFSTTLLNDIATAQATAESYTDSEISTEVTNRNSAIATAKSEAITAAENYADGLASNYDAAGAASAAQTAAQSYADGLASNYDAAGAASTAQTNAEGYADDIVGNVLSGDTAFTAVNVNSVAGIWAATSTVVSPSTNTVWAFNSSVFTSAKLLVSIKANGHSQVSEVLVTLDSAGNVAITEFGIVGTNGSLGDVTAINSSGNVSIRVTTSYANSDVIVYATTLL